MFMNSFNYALAGVGFIFAMTCAGSAMVFFFRGKSGERFEKVFLGFAAGIMIAASVWSLLIPAINMAKESGAPKWLPASVGFVLGALFLLLLDRLIPHIHIDIAGGGEVREGPQSKSGRTTLLVFAVTLHNIPEGMAVGLSFALAGQHPGDPVFLGAAIALAIGIGIQNFPEGAAISLPLLSEGARPARAFGLGCASGAVEPVFGIITVLLSTFISPAMPWLLAFAAGAMIYVVVEELIPAAHLGEHSNVGTLSVLSGFLIMMILDVALG
jgi:ZIP family zinc transporter